MKKFLFLMLSAILFSYATAKAENPETEFNKVIVNLSARVVVIEGDTCSVCVRTKNEFSKYINVDIKDNTLNISSKYEELLNNEDVKIIITTKTMPDIKAGHLYNIIDITDKYKNNEIEGEMTA